jgi:hypothetical protein
MENSKVEDKHLRLMLRQIRRLKEFTVSISKKEAKVKDFHGNVVLIAHRLNENCWEVKHNLKELI